MHLNAFVFLSHFLVGPGPLLFSFFLFLFLLAAQPSRLSFLSRTAQPRRPFFPSFLSSARPSNAPWPRSHRAPALPFLPPPSLPVRRGSVGTRKISDALASPFGRAASAAPWSVGQLAGAPRRNQARPGMRAHQPP
jgi:hypothetical protein